MRKKVTGLLFVMLFLITAMSITAFAGTNEAKIGTKEYATLAEAVSEAVDGDTVVLLKNVEFADTIEISKKITLDGNGFKASCTGSSTAAFMVNVDSLGLKNAQIESKYDGMYFSLDSEITVSGSNYITAGQHCAVIFTPWNLSVKGTDNTNDSLTLNAPFTNAKSFSFLINGDTFTSNNVSLSFNSKRGIVLESDHDKNTATVNNTVITGGAGLERMIQLWPYNGAVELTIENSELKGYGALVASADSVGKITEDTVVTVKNSELTLTNISTNNSEVLHVQATYGDAILKIEDSTLNLTQNNNDQMNINVGSCNEKDGHGIAKGLINNSKMNINGGLAGYNIWTWGSNNTKGTVLDIIDSEMIIKNEGTYAIEAYAYGNGATTYITIDNSKIDMEGSLVGLMMGTWNYPEHAGDLILTVKNKSKLEIDSKSCALEILPYNSPYNATYIQTDSDVTLKSSAGWGLYMEGGTGDSASKINMTVEGGSLTTQSVKLTGDEEADIKLNTNLTVLADSTVFCDTFEITGGTYKAEDDDFPFAAYEGKISGGQFEFEVLEEYLSDDCLFIKDKDGNYIIVNPAKAKLDAIKELEDYALEKGIIDNTPVYEGIMNIKSANSIDEINAALKDAKKAVDDRYYFENPLQYPCINRFFSYLMRLIKALIALF